MDAVRFERPKARVARDLTAEQRVELGKVLRSAAAAWLADVARARRSAT